MKMEDTHGPAAGGNASDSMTIPERLRHFLWPFDARFEDMRRDNWFQIAWRDISAGLIVAMMAIPMAMGFAMASGLRPEHGILAGAIAGLMGALFGGSKYNVYGPVAALIPMIAGLMTKYRTPEDPFAGHGFLVLICMISGVLCVLVGVAGWGRFGNIVPHSIVVGFSVGIAVTIAVTQLGEVLGLKVAVTGAFVSKLRIISQNLDQFNGGALLIALTTFLITRQLLKLSIYIPAPLIAVGAATFLSSTVLAGSSVSLVHTKYGQIPTDFFTLTPPTIPAWSAAVLFDLGFYALAFAFVCGFESILAARMADRLADNKGTAYDPNKEFWGQGLIQMFVPLLNGMPLSGALARTATNIKCGAVTPLAGIMKCVLKLGLVYFLAAALGRVPMACIGGILLWVASNMVKPAEIKEVLAHNRFHAGLMIYTATMVILVDFLVGVTTALIVYGVLRGKLDQALPLAEPSPVLPFSGERMRGDVRIRIMKNMLANPTLEVLTDDQNLAVIDALVLVAWADRTFTEEETEKVQREVLRLPWQWRQPWETVEAAIRAARERVAGLKDEAGWDNLIRDVGARLPTSDIKTTIFGMLVAVSFADGTRGPETAVLEKFRVSMGIEAAIAEAIMTSTRDEMIGRYA